MTSRFKLKVITSLTGLETLRPFWESVQWHWSADYEFFRIFVQTRKEILSPCVLVVSEGEKPVALLAGRLEQADMSISLGYVTLARIPVRQVIFMEGGFMGQKSEEIWSLLAGSLQQLFRGQQANRIILEQVKIGSVEQQVVQRAFGRRQLSVSGDEVEHWLMRMPANWDAFLKNRSKKHRYWLKRMVTVLDREFAGQWSIKKFTTGSEAADFAQAAEQVSSKTYQRGLGVGFQLQGETMRRLQLEADQGRFRGYILFIQGEPRAFWYCFVYGSTLYLGATGYDPAFRNYEVGTVLLMRVFQDHCGTDIETVDFGLGDAGYKQRFGSEKYSQTSLCILPRTVRGFALNMLQSANVYAIKSAKAFLGRFGVIQWVKTRWRRKIERKLPIQADAESDHAQLETARKANP